MTIHELLADFKTRRILVIGDIMIDAYMLGRVHRVSPEAPVPIVSLEKQDERLGGAANVALNLKSLGATPVLCAVVGSDKEGQRLKELMQQQEMLIDGIVSSEDRTTTVKTRVIGNNQQLLRIDAEDIHPLVKTDENALIATINGLVEAGSIDAIIFEDYNKGVLTPTVISEISALAKTKNIPTAVDPKKDNFLAYKGVTLFKPNLKELQEGMGINCSFADRASFDKAVHMLETELGNTISFVTLSEHGVFIKDPATAIHVPAHVRNIADVSGAGDTVISVATLCLAAGCSIRTIAELSNLAGGLVCEKSGVVMIEPDQLIAECAGADFSTK